MCDRCRSYIFCACATFVWLVHGDVMCRKFDWFAEDASADI